MKGLKKMIRLLWLLFKTLIWGNELKGNFEWEDDADLCSTCNLPAFGQISVSGSTDICPVRKIDLNSTLYDVLTKHETSDEYIEFLKTESPYRHMLNTKVKDVIRYRVYVYMAATDCDGTYVGDDFKTLDSAKSFAEKWYCDEIKKFFSIK